MSPSVETTADDLLHLSIPGKRVELLRGVLRVSEPPGFLHGDVAARLLALILNHVDQHRLGRVLAAETGFKLSSDPDTVRAADVAFVSSARLPDTLPIGYAAMGPDLVIEVLSPNDRPGEVLAKVGDWLNGGSRLVWVVDPSRRQARVYRADGSDAQVSEDESLVGEDMLPGLTIPLRTLW